MDNAASSLSVDVHPGEGIRLSPGVEIVLIQKSGQLARLKITAPRNVRIEKIEQQSRYKHGNVTT